MIIICCRTGNHATQLQEKIAEVVERQCHRNEDYAKHSNRKRKKAFHGLGYPVPGGRGPESASG